MQSASPSFDVTRLIRSPHKVPSISLGAVSVAIFVAFLTLYVATASRGFIVGQGSESEAMELQRAAVHNGIAHSTGYPAFVLSAYAFSRVGALLGDNPFSWVTYFSGFTIALALVILYHTLRMVVRPLPALIAVCAFGLNGGVWHDPTI